MPDYGREDASREVASAVRSVKEVVVVLTGLALTNSVLVLLTRGSYSNTVALRDLPIMSVLFAVVVMVTIIRFHLANARHMDAAFGRVIEASDYRGPSLSTDSVMAILQGGMLAIMSFYINDAHTVLVLFVILLSLDSVWMALNIGRNGLDSITYQRPWLLNTIATCTVLLILIIDDHTASLYLGALAVLVNTALDFAISGKFYFPSSGSRVI